MSEEDPVYRALLVIEMLTQSMRELYEALPDNPFEIEQWLPFEEEE